MSSNREHWKWQICLIRKTMKDNKDFASGLEEKKLGLGLAWRNKLL